MIKQQLLDELSGYPLQYRIRKLRCILGLSQKKFADAIGYTQTAVSRWECEGVEPNPMALERIIQCFDLPTNFFIDLEIEKIKFK